MNDFVIQILQTKEWYFTLDGKEVEYNNAIPHKYVVRYNMTGDKENPCYEDQDIFDTYEEAEACLKELQERSKK